MNVGSPPSCLLDAAAAGAACGAAGGAAGACFGAALCASAAAAEAATQRAIINFLTGIRVSFMRERSDQVGERSLGAAKEQKAAREQNRRDDHEKYDRPDRW